MPVVNTQLNTHHSPLDLHGLVSDIKAYPQFIKWIKAMRVSHISANEFVTEKLGEALVGFKGFSETFATNVRSDIQNRNVHVTLVRGPFRHLKNVWTFDPADSGGTHVKFHIDYAFSNPVLGMLARANSEAAIDRIMEAFITEADRRFGTATTR